MFPENQRKPNRLKGYNYSSDGFYFVTICVKNKKEFFGEVENGEMRLNKNGKVADKFWQEINKHYNNVDLYEYKVMPNHIHGIIVIKEHEHNVGTAYYAVPTTTTRYGQLSKIIKSFKHAVTENLKIDFTGKIWQRSFYDRIIRNEKELNKIRQYIINNPARWEIDKNNAENLLM